MAENKWSNWKITHHSLIFMSIFYQFLLCNAHTWKCYCDTPAMFRVPLVMIDKLMKMTENFWFPEIWLIVPRKEKMFLCSVVYYEASSLEQLPWWLYVFKDGEVTCSKDINGIRFQAILQDLLWNAPSMYILSNQFSIEKR